MFGDVWQINCRAETQESESRGPSSVSECGLEILSSLAFSLCLPAVFAHVLPSGKNGLPYDAPDELIFSLLNPAQHGPSFP